MAEGTEDKEANQCCRMIEPEAWKMELQWYRSSLKTPVLRAERGAEGARISLSPYSQDLKRIQYCRSRTTRAMTMDGDITLIPSINRPQYHSDHERRRCLYDI